MALRKTIRLTQHRGNRLQTPANSEPVTLTELKDQLRITDDAENQFLNQLIIDAVKEIEDTTGIAFLDQDWRLTLDHWPNHTDDWWDGVREGSRASLYGGNAHLISVELPRYPLDSITSLTVFSEDGTPTVVTVSDVFDVDTQSLRGRLSLKSGATWPVALRPTNAIQIDYKAGYGTAPTDVPAPLRRAVRQMASYMYEHRGDCSTEDAYIKSGAKSVMKRYEVVEI